MEQAMTDKIAPNLDDYRIAMMKFSEVKGNGNELQDRLKKAKIDVTRAEYELVNASRKKSQAVSMEEIQSAGREVEKHSRLKNDAESLVENLKKAIEKHPGLHTEAFNKVQRAKSDAFKQYEQEITRRLCESPEFKTVSAIIHNAFVAENIASPGASYRIFLERIFDLDTTANLHDLTEQTLIKFGIKTEE